MKDLVNFKDGVYSDTDQHMSRKPAKIVEIISPDPGQASHARRGARLRKSSDQYARSGSSDLRQNSGKYQRRQSDHPISKRQCAVTQSRQKTARKDKTQTPKDQSPTFDAEKNAYSNAQEMVSAAPIGRFVNKLY